MMRSLSVFFSVLFAVAACEDSSCPDTSGLTWQQIRGVMDKINGTDCRGSATCYFPGCANPGDHCFCEGGKWVCGHTECFPPRDRGIDVAPPKDLSADQRAKLDTPPTGDARGSFACGALLLCKTATEYCERTTPGACGGAELSDAGTCPPNCTPTTCAAGKQVCLCQSYSCKALPAGCTSCACLAVTGGCTCSQGVGGELNVHCALP